MLPDLIAGSQFGGWSNRSDTGRSPLDGIVLVLRWLEDWDPARRSVNEEARVYFGELLKAERNAELVVLACLVEGIGVEDRFHVEILSRLYPLEKLLAQLEAMDRFDLPETPRALKQLRLAVQQERSKGPEDDAQS